MRLSPMPRARMMPEITVICADMSRNVGMLCGEQRKTSTHSLGNPLSGTTNPPAPHATPLHPYAP